MYTPRPDRFTYPLRGKAAQGDPAEKRRQGQIVLEKPWMRAVFIGGLVAAFALGLALSLTS
jgi:hypothetical protein